MCFIELVDFNDNMAKTEKKAKRTRRSKKATEEVAAEAPVAEATAESAE
jgi:large subunit ribosomal protein L17